MTDTLKEMINASDWFGVAMAITKDHVNKINEPIHDGSTIDALSRAVRDAEINAGIDRYACSDTETQGELDAAQGQGWR